MLHSTTRAILDGLVLDVTDSATQLHTSGSSKLVAVNESYAIKRYPFSKTDDRQEILSDFDSMAIKSA